MTPSRLSTTLLLGYIMVILCALSVLMTRKQVSISFGVVGLEGGIWGGLGLELVENTGFERVREWVEAVWKDMNERKIIVFMTGCWAVWEWRNKVVFEGAKMAVEEAVRRTRDILAELEVEDKASDGDRGSGANKESDERSVNGWVKPTEGMIKINVDAGVKDGVGSGFGIVCRDEEGSVLRVVTIQKAEVFEAGEAEAVAILYGLQEALQAGYRTVKMESDSLVVIEALKKQKKGRRIYSLL